MILLNDFYFIRSIDVNDTNISAELEFKVDHDIFKGHFPAMPVVPGVCMMQIVHEIVERETGSAKRVREVQQMKFLTLINPQVSHKVKLALSYTITEHNMVRVTASLLNEGVVYFKFKGDFVNEGQ